jgi:DNA polymerase III delta prime subunit
MPSPACVGVPVGSFLFLGPTGVGKTELARALAAALFGDEGRMIRFGMCWCTSRTCPGAHRCHRDADGLTKALEEDGAEHADGNERDPQVGAVQDEDLPWRPGQ